MQPRILLQQPGHEKPVQPHQGHVLEPGPVLAAGLQPRLGEGVGQIGEGLGFARLARPAAQESV